MRAWTATGRPEAPLESDDRTPADDLATLVRLVEHGHLHPEIDGVRGWDATPAVIRALLAREIRGNAVVAIDR